MNTGLNHLHAWEEESVPADAWSMAFRPPEAGRDAARVPVKSPAGGPGTLLCTRLPSLSWQSFSEQRKQPASQQPFQKIWAVSLVPRGSVRSPHLWAPPAPPAHHVVSCPQPGKLTCVVAGDS